MIKNQLTQSELKYLRTLDKIEDPYKKFMAQTIWTILVLLKTELLPDKAFTKKELVNEIIKLIDSLK